MTQLEILEMYVQDLQSKVEPSPARDNRIAMLKNEIEKVLNIPYVSNIVLCDCEIPTVTLEDTEWCTKCSRPVKYEF